MNRQHNDCVTQDSITITRQVWIEMCSLHLHEPFNEDALQYGLIYSCNRDKDCTEFHRLETQSIPDNKMHLKDSTHSQLCIVAFNERDFELQKYYNELKAKIEQTNFSHPVLVITKRGWRSYTTREIYQDVKLNVHNDLLQDEELEVSKQICDTETRNDLAIRWNIDMIQLKLKEQRNDTVMLNRGEDYHLRQLVIKAAYKDDKLEKLLFSSDKNCGFIKNQIAWAVNVRDWYLRHDQIDLKRIEENAALMKVKEIFTRIDTGMDLQPRTKQEEIIALNKLNFSLFGMIEEDLKAKGLLLDKVESMQQYILSRVDNNLVVCHNKNAQHACSGYFQARVVQIFDLGLCFEQRRLSYCLHVILSRKSQAVYGVSVATVTLERLKQSLHGIFLIQSFLNSHLQNRETLRKFSENVIGFTHLALTKSGENVQEQVEPISCPTPVHMRQEFLQLQVAERQMQNETRVHSSKKMLIYFDSTRASILKVVAEVVYGDATKSEEVRRKLKQDLPSAKKYLFANQRDIKTLQKWLDNDFREDLMDAYLLLKLAQIVYSKPFIYHMQDETSLYNAYTIYLMDEDKRLNHVAIVNYVSKGQNMKTFYGLIRSKLRSDEGLSFRQEENHYQQVEAKMRQLRESQLSVDQMKEKMQSHIYKHGWKKYVSLMNSKSLYAGIQNIIETILSQVRSFRPTTSNPPPDENEDDIVPRDLNNQLRLLVRNERDNHIGKELYFYPQFQKQADLWNLRIKIVMWLCKTKHAFRGLRQFSMENCIFIKHFRKRLDVEALLNKELTNQNSKGTIIQSGNGFLSNNQPYDWKTWKLNLVRTINSSLGSNIFERPIEYLLSIGKEDEQQFIQNQGFNVISGRPFTLVKYMGRYQQLYFYQTAYYDGGTWVQYLRNINALINNLEQDTSKRFLLTHEGLVGDVGTLTSTEATAFVRMKSGWKYEEFSMQNERMWRPLEKLPERIGKSILGSAISVKVWKFSIQPVPEDMNSKLLMEESNLNMHGKTLMQKDILSYLKELNQENLVNTRRHRNGMVSIEDLLNESRQTNVD